jgi:tetratricopeptide (TPR) repeat protein
VRLCEENTPAFWFAMAFEELFAVSCISLGLNLGLLGEVTFGLFALTTLTMVIYAVGDATRRALKYPLRIFRFWYQGEFLDAAQELQTFLAKHPGDRETLYLLAGTYDRAGNHEAALDLYAEMVSMGGGWGRLVARAMVRSQEKF